jgi:O-antigen/teichoic acid export membrane protein
MSDTGALLSRAKIQLRSKKGAVFLSLIDQAVLSAMSLAVNLILVKLAAPLNVGIFAVATAMMFFAVGIQGALVTTPAAVRIFGAETEAKVEVLSTLTTIDLFLNLGLTVAMFFVCLLMEFSLHQALATSLFLGTSMIRELARSILVGVGDIAKCLMLDGAFLVVSTVSIVILWQFVAPEIACLIGLSVGNILSLVGFCPAFHRQPSRMAHHLGKYPAYWKESRWMLVGATATDLQDRSYIFVLQFLRGATVLGTVHAGRFLVAPLSLLTTAWGRSMRPRMANYLANDDREAARKIVRQGIWIMLALTAVYIVVLLGLWKFIDQHLFAGRYENMLPIVLAWCGYGMLNVPANCMSFYFQAERRFKPLAVNAVIAGLGTLACMFALVLPVPHYVAICCLYAGTLIALAAQFRWWRDKSWSGE